MSPIPLKSKPTQRLIIDLNVQPRIYTIDNFVTPQECAHFIAQAKGKGMDRAVVSGAKKGEVSEGRTNSVTWIEHGSDIIFKKVAQRVAALVGFPLSHAEKFQLINYGPGEQYKPHFDAFDPQTPSGRRTWKGGGQRLITTLCYLNTPAKGGATIFPKLNLSVSAELGKLVIFHNCLAGSDKRDPLSLHGGAPVEAGEKWAFNLWFRAGKRSGKAAHESDD